LIIACSSFDGLNVSLARAMAAFAAGAVFHIFGCGLGMNGFIENFGMDRMASRTCLRSCIIARLSLSGHFPNDRRRRVRFWLFLPQAEEKHGRTRHQDG